MEISRQILLSLCSSTREAAPREGRSSEPTPGLILTKQHWRSKLLEGNKITHFFEQGLEGW